MTQIQQSEYACPSCGQVVRQTTYPSVNVTLDPGLKDRLLSFELFRVTCPGCRLTAHAAYDLLYHDMRQALMIRLAAQGSTPELAQTLADGISSLTTRDLYKLRIVASPEDLIEKILIFDAGLNDAIIEVLKVSLPGQEPSLRSATLRFTAHDDSSIGFAVLRPGESPTGISFGREYYDQVAGQAFPDLVTQTEARGRWLTVDADAVGRYLMSRQA